LKEYNFSWRISNEKEITPIAEIDLSKKQERSGEIFWFFKGVELVLMF